MKALIEGRRAVRVAEVALAAAMTLTLLPMLVLYVLDLSTGRIGPGAAWALGVAIGLLGIWAALLATDSLYQRKPLMRWAVLAALAVAVTFMANIAWDMRASSGFTSLVAVASAGVAVHQLVRLLRL